jgi:hypothetical protein
MGYFTNIGEVKYMLTSYTISSSDFIPELDPETVKQIIVSIDKGYIYLAIIIVIFLLISSYLLYFK